jgi:hypothetical protein
MVATWALCSVQNWVMSKATMKGIRTAALKVDLMVRRLAQ